MNRLHFAFAVLLFSLHSFSEVQHSPADRTLNHNRATAIIFQDLQNYPDILQQVRLLPADEVMAASIVSNFVRQFLEYGKDVDAGQLTLIEFFHLRDYLVESTLAQLQHALSREGWTKFDRFVRTRSDRQLIMHPPVNAGLIRTSL